MEEKIKYQLRNLIIPAHIYKDNRLNWTSARVYSFIHSYTNPFFFSNEHLAEMFGVHEQTISTAMKQLEELGLVKLTYSPKADGGKIRLSEIAHSERAKSLIGSKKVQAPNERSRSDKDIKGNNKKENFEEEKIVVGNNLTPSQKRHLKEMKKKAFGNQYRGGSSPQSSGSTPRYEKKERKVVLAEDVV